MEEKKILDKKPMILVFAGPNGSGKTTLKDYFQIVGEYTNADDLVRVAGIDNYSAAKDVDNRRYKAEVCRLLMKLSENAELYNRI